ncbi:MAG: alpha/beta hydrolase [Bacillota bacterium]|nr:alpha/beta hydrolase [Bacillota bacterium]
MTFVNCLLAAAGIYVLLVLAPSAVLYKVVFRRKNGIMFTDRDLSKTYLSGCADKMCEDIEHFRKLEYEPVSVTVPDGTELKGHYYSLGGDKLAICFHGYGSTTLNCFATMGRFLRSRGYDLLMPVERGHGESGGKCSTLGVLEQYDVKKWVEWACERDGIEKIVVAGVSMGCVAAAYASDAICGGKVKALILDCGYTSPYNQVIQDCKKRHLPYRLMMPVISTCAKIFDGLELKEPVWTHLERTTIPALFIHGGGDETVPLKETKINYEHCASPKRLYIAPEANHANAFLTGGKEAENAMKEFLDCYVERRYEV